MDQAITDIESLGAEVFEVTIPNLEQIVSYPSLSGYEFKFQQNNYLTSLGPYVPVRTLTDIIESGKFHPSLESGLKYRNARESLDDDESYQDIITNRPKLAQESLMSTFNDHNLDAILYPTSNALPAKVGGGQGAGSANRLSPYSGFPAI